MINVRYGAVHGGRVALRIYQKLIESHIAGTFLSDLCQNSLISCFLVMSEVLPSDTSCIPDLVDDRGPARYFHGRRKILNNFKGLMSRAVTINGRTTMLIQGAPGAGKTALLEELALESMEKGWDAFQINLEDLYNPVHMAQTLGKPYVSRKQTSIKADAKLVATEHIKEVAGDSSVSQVLENLNPNQGVLLILDEAQRIAHFSDSPDKISVMATLDNIHNGHINNPIILLVAGLGSTEEGFRTLGISRFKAGCFIELGALGEDSERAVIHDWIRKEGGAQGNPELWIDAIAEKTHGWPQHVSAYGDAAAKQIQRDHGEMTSAGLKIVYNLGKERREAYYEQRAKGITRKERSSLANLIVSIPIGDGLDRDEFETALSQEYDSEKAKSLFNKAVERGILHSQDEIYIIPIPSMRNWLISNYARERVEIPQTTRVHSKLHR